MKGHRGQQSACWYRQGQSGLATPSECREEGKRLADLLQDVPVELLLAVAQELPDHLAAEALPLQQEVSNPNGGVWDEASGDQELDPFVWVSARQGQRHGESARSLGAVVASGSPHGLCQCSPWDVPGLL